MVKSMVKQIQPLIGGPSRHNFFLNEEHYKLVLEGSQDGIWDWDIVQGVSYWNDRFYELIGCARSEFLPTTDNFLNLIHPDDRERFLHHLTAHLKYNKKYEIELRIRHASGKYLYIYTRGKSLRDKEGNVLRMAGTATDITERKQIELELEQARATAELANKKKSQFLANVSHELRTPLNAVIGYSEMLENGMAGELTEKQQKYIHNVAVSSRHLLDMVNELLDLSKIEAGKVQLHVEKIHIQTLLDEYLMTFEKLMKDKQVTVSYTIDPDVDYIEADPIRMRQIFLNLVTNGIKFNRPDGTLHIRIFKAADQDAMVCEIEDTGIGISEDKIPELFSEFYQVDNSYARQYEGTGLGLAVTKRLVELHGGTIWVKSRLGEGSTFIFTLPLLHSVPCSD